MKLKYFLFIPLVIFLITLLLLNLYSAITITGIYFLVYLLFGFKEDIAEEMLVAVCFSLFITSYQHYVYDGVNIFIGTVNVYSFVLWTLGLVAIRELYEYLNNRLVLSSILYLIILFIVEYIGYNFAGVQLSAEYPGIFGTDIIHGPPMIHYFYVLAGPLYLVVTKILKIK